MLPSTHSSLPKLSKIMKENLSELTRDYWVASKVKVLHSPSSVTFLRECVASFTPAILEGMIDDWPARKKWSPEYLSNTLGDKLVKVNFTSNGRADSVQEVCIDDKSQTETRFTYPLETQMPFNSFLSMLTNPSEDDAIPYLSGQNDNFRESFEELNDAIPSEFELAKDAFGLSAPEALNIWIGDERSVSSLHKDHFENFYAVIHGTKTFVLLPPTDSVFLPEHTFPTASVQQRQMSSSSDATDCKFHSIKKSQLKYSAEGCPNESLSWIHLDPLSPTVLQDYPSYKYAHPVYCEVTAGQVLYIPAMWYHRVSQRGLTVSVNYWYDQRFDFRYVFIQTLRTLNDNDESENTRCNKDS